ncbi:MAG: hypothetical protein HY089_07325 [Ignavibacteriales bacterium]|nr:hypothetical protein [Ignavibacteriales bacterium]
MFMISLSGEKIFSTLNRSLFTIFFLCWLFAFVQEGNNRIVHLPDFLHTVNLNETVRLTVEIFQRFGFLEIDFQTMAGGL